MGGYVEGPYTLRAGEKIAVRTVSQFHVRTVGSATAIVLLDVNQPASPINLSANTSTWLKKNPGQVNDPTVEAVGGYVVINDPLGSGVPEPQHYW
jgi:hypothetical protein